MRRRSYSKVQVEQVYVASMTPAEHSGDGFVFVYERSALFVVHR